MRALLLASVLLLSACQQEQPADKAAPAVQERVSGELSVFAGAGRDRMCVGATAGVVSYGSGDASCLVRGQLQGNAFVPNGDEQCRMPVTKEVEDRLTFGALPPSCAYYCGPGASLEGKTFVRMAKPEPVTDIAGDPLC